jgi:hypothetical protein
MEAAAYGQESSSEWLKACDNHPNVVCVSKFVADRINSKAYVNSFVSYEDFIYSPYKKDYFIHIAGFGWRMAKRTTDLHRIKQKVSQI